MGSESESLDSSGRDIFAEKERLNQLLNDLDDKADIRDGIAELKGKLLRTSGEDVNMNKLGSHEKQTKISRILNEMRTYLDREKERRAKLRIQNEL